MLLACAVLLTLEGRPLFSLLYGNFLMLTSIIMANRRLYFIPLCNVVAMSILHGNVLLHKNIYKAEKFEVCSVKLRGVLSEA